MKVKCPSGRTSFWVKFPTVRSLTRVKCPGIARGGGTGGFGIDWYITYEYFCFEVVCWQTTYFSYLFQFTMLQRLYFKSKRCKVKQKRSTSIPGLFPLPISKGKALGTRLRKDISTNKQTLKRLLYKMRAFFPAF